MKPIRIGITSPLVTSEELPDDLEVSRHCAAVERAGAEPFLLCKDMDPLRVVAEHDLCGIVFSGGGDVSAARYGGDEELANVDVDAQRDAFEFALMQHVLGRNLPVLAVCRGMQVANVVLGGTLIEDIRYELGTDYVLFHHQIKESGLSRNVPSHAVTIAPGTLLHSAAGAERLHINSFHHQAVRELAAPLRAIAHSDDGIIEAVEFAESSASKNLPQNDRPRFFIGVQWHPEVLPDDTLSRRLYAQLVAACAAQ